MLKQDEKEPPFVAQNQPPSGGCVLKPAYTFNRAADFSQPPSGGCVLKPIKVITLIKSQFQPPSGGCVLKLDAGIRCYIRKVPAAFRRLCVETDPSLLPEYLNIKTSRLQAAVC